jgi:hypothetical protein
MNLGPLEESETMFGLALGSPGSPIPGQIAVSRNCMRSWFTKPKRDGAPVRLGDSN